MSKIFMVRLSVPPVVLTSVGSAALALTMLLCSGEVYWGVVYRWVSSWLLYFYIGGIVGAVLGMLYVNVRGDV